ncbi:hypothetical protein F3I27_23225 [Pantoea sp. Bo_2]|uniref:Uncharacterized protein n=1 Tax=Candidatus Pantoea gossypiicola TaxID=2608008 RepID=A0AB34CJU8_9GAMM|nr:MULTISPECIES: hypothetical protein [Pantoea]KAA5923450.1 hypothetical protein F3I59_21155 [Pantoea sp. VH_8]KAA5929194.1 hypothetical protein F3I58_21370 [Pantoea sp. VH_4]KAA5935356.1 hypothetical protein F3I57_23380 [Pantoea sp. VH_3]KAA5944904.1 hypothetical protein F3I56_23120 [Pantoea sp. VH_25]KAA5949413.1 hypothetical protein F3I55_22780 [Pantoea sp. VH_24]
MSNSLSELVSDYEGCITDSAVDSLAAIEKKFSLTQGRQGWDTAVKGLAMALIIAENRRRFLETDSK